MIIFAAVTFIRVILAIGQFLVQSLASICFKIPKAAVERSL